MGMGKRTPPAFDATLQKANLWLKDIQATGNMRSRLQAYGALRCVLHALRDCLRPGDAVKLAAQMPLLIKGIFFDGWSLGSKPVRMSREKFLGRLSQELAPQAGLDPLDALRAVLAALYRHLSSGELDEVRQVLPREVRALTAELTPMEGPVPRPPAGTQEGRMFSA